MMCLKQSVLQKWGGMILVCLVGLSSLPAFSSSNIDRLGIPLDGRDIEKNYHGRTIVMSTRSNIYKDLKIKEYKEILSTAEKYNNKKVIEKSQAMIDYYQRKEEFEIKKINLISSLIQEMSKLPTDSHSQEIISKIKALNSIDKYVLAIEHDEDLNGYWDVKIKDLFSYCMDKLIVEYARAELKKEGLSEEAIEKKLRNIGPFTIKAVWLYRFENANNIRFYDSL